MTEYTVTLAIVPYLIRDNLHALYAWALAMWFVKETGSGGKVNGKRFRRWLRRHGYPAANRQWDRLLDSGLVDKQLNKGCVYLYSTARVTEVLVNVARWPGLEPPNYDGRTTVFAASMPVSDGFSIPAFKAAYTQLLASRPTLRYLEKGRRREPKPKTTLPIGRSHETVSYEANVSRRSVMRHTKHQNKVSQYEQLVDADLAGRDGDMARMGVESSFAFRATEEGLAQCRVQNSFVAPCRLSLKILLEQKGGRWRVKGSRHTFSLRYPTKIVNGRRVCQTGWLIENPDALKRILPAGPVTINRFRELKEKRPAVTGNRNWRTKW
ncbi:MAG: hypothetical protein C4523_18690 [Myxococcales bacterium]|nr:MAG: hypothetical protein C4523_18690 [Myxococcales bacterium]